MPLSRDPESTNTQEGFYGAVRIGLDDASLRQNVIDCAKRILNQAQENGLQESGLWNSRRNVGEKTTVFVRVLVKDALEATSRSQGYEFLSDIDRLARTVALIAHDYQEEGEGVRERVAEALSLEGLQGSPSARKYIEQIPASESLSQDGDVYKQIADEFAMKLRQYSMELSTADEKTGKPTHSPYALFEPNSAVRFAWVSETADSRQ